MRLFDETEDAVNGRPGAADFVAAWARRGPKDVDALAREVSDDYSRTMNKMIFDKVGRKLTKS